MNIHYKGNIYIDYQYQVMTPGFIGSVSDFEEHVSTITHYLYIGDEKLKDGQQVFEGVDYELKKIGIVDDEFVELMGGKEIFEAIGIPKVTHEGEEQVIYDSGRMRSEKIECICTYPEKMLHGNKNCPVHREKIEEENDHCECCGKRFKWNPPKNNYLSEPIVCSCTCYTKLRGEMTEKNEQDQEQNWIDVFAMIITGKWNIQDCENRFLITRK